MNRTSLVLLLSVFFCVTTHASAPIGKYFDRVIIVVFENNDYAKTIQQPFFRKLAKSGANFSNFMAITHPSQPNYFALTSGSTQGVSSNKTVDVNSNNIVDLLEAKKLTWKVYAEDYPSDCFSGAKSARYVRKHNPFISYLNIQSNPVRCANIVGTDRFNADVENGDLPSYVFFIPNNTHNGHDTNVAYADRWYKKRFSKIIANEQIMNGTVLITTFDENSGKTRPNKIYTSIIGPSVKQGVYREKLNLYSLLNLIEDNWDLGDLGNKDAGATPIPSAIWR